MQSRKASASETDCESRQVMVGQGGICRVGDGDVSWSLDFGIPTLQLIQTSLGGTFDPLTRMRLWGRYHR